MGGTNWSEKEYASRAKLRAETGTPVFAFHEAVRTGKTTKKVHDTLNPFDVKIRESRDSEAHPASNAVAALFDVTGSMMETPPVFQEKLAKLMALILKNGYITDPQLLIGAIGDACSDRAPLQVGQFESGIEIEDNLTNLFLEGNGGSSSPPQESYELALYFLARHTALDCYEKRQRKGYAFLIGDENPYLEVNRKHIKKVFGEDIQEDIPTETILKEVQEKYHLFVIVPGRTSHSDDKVVINRWRQLIGQNLLRLENPEGICELIAGTIAVTEGAADLDFLKENFAEAGTSAATSKAVCTVLAPYAAANPKGVPATIPDSGAESGLATL